MVIFGIIKSENKRRDKMDKLSLFNVDNMLVDVDVIRYFRLNNNEYLIYSLNEVDEQSYVKLYAVKINRDGDFITGSNIVDENEWNAVKEKIKTIIIGNKEGNLDVEDLDYNQLFNLKINEYRIFKLSTQLTDLLKANKKSFEPVLEANPVPTEEPVPAVETEPVFPTEQYTTSTPEETNESMPEVDYQAMYLAEKANNERLVQEIEKLKNKINSIKETINNLF